MNRTGIGGRGAILALALFACFLLVPRFAHAAPGCDPGGSSCPPLLSQFGKAGAEAGQFRTPTAIAADPVSGQVFVAEETRVDVFDAKGNFVKAWGWGVIDGAAEPQVCTAETGCRKGVPGSGPGQVSGPATAGYGIAVDEEGNVWVLEFENHRIQKFSPEGDFLLVVGGEVNKTAVEEREEQEANAEPVTITEAEENLCTAASGDVCGVGVEGTGNAEFGFIGFNDPVALGPGGTIYVGDVGRIQKFDEEGNFEGAIPLPGAGKTESLTVTPAGRIYVINEKIFQKVGSTGASEVNSWVVREVGPAGEELRRLVGEWEGKKTPKDPVAVTSDAEGNVYISAKVVYELPVEEEGMKFKEFREVVAFDSSGNLINFEPAFAGFDRPTDSTQLVSLATNVVQGTEDPGEVLVGHFFDGPAVGKPPIAYIRSYGIPFEGTEDAPEITDQFTVSATDTEASVEALINPHFTVDTTYQVEYGTGKCSEGGCESVVPVPAAQLGGGAVNTPVATGPVELAGLATATVYHFRFSAQNGKGAAAPIGEGTFRTFAEPTPPEPCPNDALRLGASALLPDCRAYEMVSPVHKEGGEVFVMGSVPGFPAGINQATPEGEDLTYSSYRAFSNPTSAPYTSQYIARRDPASGWASEAISPPREGTIVPGLDTQYRAFSEDLSQGWLVTDSEPVLAEGGLPGYRNIYRRDNDTGAYRAQCGAKPEGTSVFDYRLEPQGSSADGSHLVFLAEGQLEGTGAAPIGKVPQLYECVNGTELRLVSVLPGGEASPDGGSAGTTDGGLGGYALRISNVTHAISEDGSRIFWTAKAVGSGPLHVRIDGTETVQIAPASAHFHAASPAGDRVVYSVDDDLFEASVEPGSASSTKIAGEVDGVMGMSEDTELVYLVSKEDLDAGGPAKAGEHNLYLYRAEGDSFAFIGAFGARDVVVNPIGIDPPAFTPIALSPFNRSSRVSPNGLHAAFTSAAPLTGFDNTDQAGGEEDAEVFVYDAEEEELLCASCSPSGARPKGINIGTPINPYWTAAYLPGWENQFHASRALSEGGERLFFNAIDPLALGDTNGVQDVYEWQAPGSGSCKESSPTYSPANGGCIDLLSTGKSPQPSELIDASASGDDVFFKTAQSLWEPDPGLVDLYDARVGGGFAPPPPGPVPCSGDCQQRGPEPQDPASATALSGPGNVVESRRPRSRKCRKGARRLKRAGGARCAKNKKSKAKESRRPGR